ncbi:MAG: hypothetical protein HRT45_14220 [Bdellovibrionales bacterium]|nr:hypothetical protein [Bdellovibrionales bacterium]
MSSCNEDLRAENLEFCVPDGAIIVPEARDSVGAEGFGCKVDYLLSIVSY